MIHNSWKYSNILHESISILDLTIEDVEDIKTELAIIKEDFFDGEAWDEEPDSDDQSAHDTWLGMSWNEFEELPVSELDKLDIEPGLLKDVIEEVKENIENPCISDIYDYLDEIEENL